MANGDIKVTIEIVGGSTSKEGVIPKATADLAIAWIKANATNTVTDSDGNVTEEAITTNAQCLAFEVNKVLAGVTNRANKQQNSAAVPSAKTFTAIT